MPHAAIHQTFKINKIIDTLKKFYVLIGTQTALVPLLVPILYRETLRVKVVLNPETSLDMELPFNPVMALSFSHFYVFFVFIK